MRTKLVKHIIFQFLAVVIDCLVVAAAHFLAYMAVSAVNPNVLIDYRVSVTYAIVLCLVLFFYDVYTLEQVSGGEVILSVIISTVLTTVATLIIAYIFGFSSNIWYVILMAVIVLIVLAVFHYFFYKLAKKTVGKKRLLVIEKAGVLNRLASKIINSYQAASETKQVFIDESDKGAVGDLLDNVLANYDGIFISPLIAEGLRQDILSRALDLKREVFILPNTTNINLMKSEIVHFDDTPAMRITAAHMSNFQRLVKRAFDIAVSAVAIIITSPAMLICALAVKLDSEGPVLYKQERLTYHKKPFYVWKFRTMCNNAEKLTGATLATEDDPRITKVGKVLRSLRLDELPQFFNIFFGSMSVIGPRPERPVFVEEYLQKVKDYDKRFEAKAGLTGYAQVYGKYDTRVSDKILMDILYINQYSLWLDVKIILLTIKIMFVKESSQGISETDGKQSEIEEARLKAEQRAKEKTTV